MAEANEDISKESRRVLCECFQQFDYNGDGHISKEELPDALRFVGINPINTDLDDLIKYFDKNGDGLLQITELVDNWKQLAQHSVNGKELMDAFKALDLDNDGFITLPELKKVLTTSGEKWSEQEAAQLLQELMKYDKNGDGKFDYSEFVDMFADDEFPFKRPEVEQIRIHNKFKMTKTGGKEHS